LITERPILFVFRRTIHAVVAVWYRPFRRL